MPSLGADMVSGRLVEWLVAPGDAVKRGDLVAVVDTDKGAMEIEFFEDGVIEALLVEEDTKVPVGTVMARFRPAEGGQAAAAPATDDRDAPGAPHSVRASPAARRAARQLGLDLTEVQGSGPDGAVVLADLPTQARGGVEDPGNGPDASADGSSSVARSMARSNREIPHYYVGTEIDMAPALAWLRAHNAERPITERVLYAALLVKAIASCCRRHPSFNGWFRAGRFEAAPRVDVSVAISLRGGGLVAPAISGADQLDVDAIMERLSDLVERARSGRLRRSEMVDGTITVTNLGPRGTPTVFPLIAPPQVAIVGFGRMQDRAWVVDQGIEVRPILSCTLAADHRVTHGHEGGLFLRTLESLLGHPDDLQRSP